MRRLIPITVLLLAATAAVCGQSERGQLRVQVQDSTGAAVPASIALVSDANHIERKGTANESGEFISHNLPFGVYHLTVSQAGFATADRLIEIRSEPATNVSITLGVAPVTSAVTVNDAATLLDPARTSTTYTVGAQMVNESLAAQPGRSLTDLINDQPGWLYEANGVLHPRGSEYGVQYVVDGMPITENRSPAFAPPFDADEAESLRVRTAGYPAEYGRKLGGIVEVSTPPDLPAGLHVKAAATGGSFESAAGFAGLSYGRGKNQLSFSANGGTTDRYLDPPVIANFTNYGSFGGFSGSYSRDLSQRDRLRFSLTHSSVDFQVPNELIQQKAGQRQQRSNASTSGLIAYQRILSDNVLLSAEGSVRDNSANLNSNALATPVVASQQRGFREGYARVDLAGHFGMHDWKVGADGLFSDVHEALQYAVSDPSQFDPDLQQAFNFAARAHDREQAAYVQDQAHWRNWNVSAGLRFDHYSFLMSESTISPRLAISHFFSQASVLVHATYDRTFETPATENLLLASSPLLDQISPLVVRLPVRPARGNYYEVGFTKAVLGKISLTANLFRRDFANYADDDLLLNTGVSFPIAFASAIIQGTEAKLEVQRFGKFSGFLSYANQSGIGEGPITGGLFLGAEAVDAMSTQRFAISQDQRNSLRGQARYQMNSRAWLAFGGKWGSGLPAEISLADLDEGTLLAQYGPDILSRVDLVRGRARPSLSLDVAGGVQLHQRDRGRIGLQAQVANLTNRLNVINFAGLFSGTAVGPPRSLSLKLGFEF